MEKVSNKSPLKESDNVLDEVQLCLELKHLKQHLSDRDSHIASLETDLVKYSNRIHEVEDQVCSWRDKHDRLYDSYKRVQKLNQVLEDKLLQMVDKMKGEKSQLTKDIATLSVRLAESKHNYGMLQKENERYKNDMNLAIQLLQCKPDNFVSQKLDNLPVDTQARVSQYVMSKTSKQPTAAIAKPNNENDFFDTTEYEFNISASLMTKILEDSIQDTVTKHCDTCTCSRSQAKPFCYNESYYSVATQTSFGDNYSVSRCSNCDSVIKEDNSNTNKIIDVPLNSRVINDRFVPKAEPLVSAPLIVDSMKCTRSESNKKINESYAENNSYKSDSISKTESAYRLANKTVDTEPTIHHKLCDRSVKSDSKKENVKNIVGDDFPISKIPMSNNEFKLESKDPFDPKVRKNSHSSVGAMSRTSSVAKSSVSTNKTGGQIGPGPRFCHLRMQAGSKNILLDNAHPDVPPVVYTRQTKYNDNPLYKNLNDDENIVIVTEAEPKIKNNNNVVVESTLIDVHVDNNRDFKSISDNTTINPILMNVSSSPLQPLKTHNYTINEKVDLKSERNKVNTKKFSSLTKTDFLKEHSEPEFKDENEKEFDSLIPDKDKDLKIFNFDSYENQKSITNTLNSKSLKRMDMTALDSIENTKIPKDLSFPKNPMGSVELNETKSMLYNPVNVYPNLAQTHLKMNKDANVFINDKSTSSQSSDDSAALLHKQQLLRVAEWVEQNLDRQNSNIPDEDASLIDRSLRKEEEINRLTNTINELALNMPHPVSKYSKSYNKVDKNWLNENITIKDKGKSDEYASGSLPIKNVVKETIFPVESSEATYNVDSNHSNLDVSNKNNQVDLKDKLNEALRSGDEKDVSPEELARMEYNVKKFLLSGPQWDLDLLKVNKHTSSKTETDV